MEINDVILNFFFPTDLRWQPMRVREYAGAPASGPVSVDSLISSVDIVDRVEVVRYATFVWR
jgi:hypothetical protein